MQTEELFELSPPVCMANLDVALNELGMLATSTNSRREYLNEVKLNMVTIDTKYVSSVSIKGYKTVDNCRARANSFKQRFRPYKLPKARHRTKSENNDVEAASNLAQVIVEECLSQSLVEINQLKKAKSLESIMAASSDVNVNKGPSVDFKNVNFSSHFEVEKVSDSIQNLKVKE